MCGRSSVSSVGVSTCERTRRCVVNNSSDGYTSFLGQGGVALLFKILEEGVNFLLTIGVRAQFVEEVQSCTSITWGYSNQSFLVSPAGYLGLSRIAKYGVVSVTCFFSDGLALVRQCGPYEVLPIWIDTIISIRCSMWRRRE
jgi:hypothetical protein